MSDAVLLLILIVAFAAIMAGTLWLVGLRPSPAEVAGALRDAAYNVVALTPRIVAGLRLRWEQGQAAHRPHAFQTSASTVAAPSVAPLAPPSSPLYTHVTHPHTTRNVNAVHQAEQAAAGVNQRLAVTLTKAVGTMWTAYVFCVLALIGLFGLLGWLNPFTFLLATWVSQQFLQLVFLPILSVGQNVLSRHAELQADETYHNTAKLIHEMLQNQHHLGAQDTVLVDHTEKIAAILTHLETLAAQSGLVQPSAPPPVYPQTTSTGTTPLPGVLPTKQRQQATPARASKKGTRA